MINNEALEKILNHPLVKAITQIIVILKKITPKKNFYVVVLPLILFIITNMISILRSEALSNFIEKELLKTNSSEWQYYVLNFLDIVFVEGSIPFLIICLIIFGVLSYIENKRLNNEKDITLKNIEKRKPISFDISSRFILSEKLNTILNNSIEREIENDILNSLENNDNPIVVMQGEEGNGKTILSLQLSKKILKKGITVRYFFSNEWSNINNLEELLRDRNKDLKFDGKNIVVFLDGVNERNALETANKILTDNYDIYGIRSSMPIGNLYNIINYLQKKCIKLIFITRHLQEYTNYNKSIWDKFKIYNITKFSDNEFEQAVKKLDTSYNIDEFPSNLRTVASIPRYLNLAFSLKGRFQSYSNITKEILYWERLKEQIENDIEFKTKLNITSKENIQSIFFDIKSSISIKNDKVIINKNKLKEIFGEEYLKIQIPLKENRITLKQNYSGVELNFDFVLIAYSFYILNYIEDEIINELTFEELADKIKFKLEPYDNDKMANIPFIIFQLANEDLIENDKFYSALLYLWFKNHNSVIDSSNLKLWAENQFKSYCNILDVVELKNKSFDRDKLKDLMISLLGIIWEESKGKNKELESYIQNIIEEEFSDEFRNEYIIKKRALTILMYYPLDKFITSFLIMYKNIENLNPDDKYWIKHNLYKCIEILFRFGYLEDIFEELKENNKYTTFAKYFHSKTLNKEMVLNDNSLSYKFFEEYNDNNLVPFNDNIKDYAFSKISHLKYCACRKDIELNDEQIDFIKNSIENIFKYTEKNLHINKTAEDYKIEDLMPIISKIDSDYFINISFKFLQKFLSFKEEAHIIHKYDLLILSESQKKIISTYIIKNLDNLIKDDGIQKNSITHFINLLIELMLFTARKVDLRVFFTYLIESDFSEIFTNNTPIDFYIKELFGKELLIIINNKLKNIDSSSEQFNTLMIYLYILEKFDNELLIQWSIKKLTDDKIKKDSKEFYKNIIVNSSPNKNFINLYINENLKDYLYNSKSSEQGRYISHWITREDNFFNNKTFEELLDIIPLDSIGNLLIHNKRYDDIDKWGDYLFKDFSRDLLNDYYVTDAIEKYAKRNETKFLEYAINYLTYINNQNIRSTIFFSFRKFEDDLIKLLASLDFDKAYEFYSKTKNSNHIINKFMLEIFDIKKYSNEKFIMFRKNYILSLKNDMEILNIVRLYHHTKSESELKVFISEWIKSYYSKDRLLAVSLITWFGNDYAIDELSELIKNDDSYYVKYYASWAKEVCLQEKYSKEIYEDILNEDNLEVLSSKLHQIKPVLTPMCHNWVNELNEKYNIYDKNTFTVKRIHISRFWNRIIDSSLKDEKKFEINKRKLSEYYLGENIDNEIKQLLSL